MTRHSLGRGSGTCDGLDLGVEADVRPQVEAGAVIVQVLEVAGSRKEVRVIVTRTEVGETGELFGRDELWHVSL